MSAIERHRELVLRELRRCHGDALFNAGRARVRREQDEEEWFNADAKALSEVIAELERESARAGGSE